MDLSLYVNFKIFSIGNCRLKFFALREYFGLRKARDAISFTWQASAFLSTIPIGLLSVRIKLC